MIYVIPFSKYLVIYFSSQNSLNSNEICLVSTYQASEWCHVPPEILMKLGLALVKKGNSLYRGDAQTRMSLP